MYRATPLLAATAMFATASFADIPGLFALQEGKIVDPGPRAATSRTSFGAAQIAVVGDIDKDGNQDIAIGAPLQDSGAIYFQRLNASGAPTGAMVQFNARHSILKPLLETGPYADQFGSGLAMVQPFSKTQSCGVLMTSSGAVRKLWLLKVCRDDVSLIPDITQAVAFDTASPALSGLALNGAGLGSSLTVLDTLTTGERVVAISAQTDGATASSMEGKVILVQVNPTNLTMTRLAVFPQAYGSGDPVGSKLVAGEGFGMSIAPLRGAGGAKGMAVVSPAWAPSVGATVTGRIMMITFGADWQAASVTPMVGTSDPTKTGPVYAAAAADFNHDGISDLVLGYPTDAGASLSQLGMVKLLLLGSDGLAKDSTFFRRGSGTGFVDTTAYLASSCRWGTRVATTDIDGDGQMDMVVGSRGNLASAAVDVVGSVWPLRLKSAPWRIRAIDTIGIANTSWTGRNLSEYIKGNDLKWSLVPPSVVPDPVATCQLSGTGASARVECMATKSNGVTHAKVAVWDTGNIPADLHYRDTLDYPVKVSGLNAPPERIKAIPVIHLTEDHADTAILKFSSYYRDPEGQPMSIGLQTYDGAISNLIAYRQSNDKDSLYVKPVQFKNGICSLKVVVTDNFNVSIEDKIRIEISHVNHQPVGVADVVKAKENDSTALFDVLANDIDNDNDPLTATITTLPKHGVARILNNKLRYVPTLFFNGWDTVWYTAKDGSQAVSDPVMCRIEVRKADSLPVVYQKLRDTTLATEVDTIKIKIDSLFFSGFARWEFDVVAPFTNTCQSLARISYKSELRTLYLVPIPYQSGTCQIVVQDYGPWDVADTMSLTIPFVAHPYKFKKEKVSLTIAPGAKQTLEFDSLDLDHFEMEYVPGAGWPAWMGIRGFRMDLAPDANSNDILTTLMARHKVRQGDPEAPFTDTLQIEILIDANTNLRGRKIGGLSIETTIGGRLLIHGGDQEFQAMVFDARGSVSEIVRGQARQTTSIDLSRWGKAVYLRLDEGGRSKIVPLFLQH